MLFANSAKEEMESYKKLIEINKVKNIIIHNVQTNDERIDYLNKNKINFVAWGRSKKINYSWVDLDNELSTELIVDHLCSKGHDKFGFINVSEKYNFVSVDFRSMSLISSGSVSQLPLLITKFPFDPKNLIE